MNLPNPKDSKKTMSLNVQTLGQYQIVESIGAGGMATVYKAYQPGLDRHVAIKVLPAQHALTPGFTERFFLEAKAVAQLSHPNILPIYDVGVEGDLSYFVMKHVPGRTLQDLLGRPMDLPTVSHYLDQMAGALDHAHDSGIIHRDVKPSNILLEDDWLLLADFGLAKIVMGSQDLTGSGTVLGTPAYLSPEQARGDAIDHRADIYSLGIVLYEMVLGQVPFEAETPLGVVLKHISEPVPRPRQLRPDLPASVERILLKAMAKEPAKRFDQAGEMAQALHAIVQPSSLLASQPEPAQPARLFISYKRNAIPDQTLANYLYDVLTRQGHSVFLDRTLRTGDDWLAEIDQGIKDSDFLVVLLSEASADSEMVKAEIKRAYEYRKLQGHPHTFPVRVAYEGLLPYSIDAFLDPLQYVVWENEADNQRVADEILAAMAGRLPQRTPTPTSSGDMVLSEDGGVIADETTLPPPLPEFDPRFLEALAAPGGVVKLRDQFYIERRADDQLKREVVKSGTTTTIRASRQTGKSSLLVRGVNYARQQGAKIVNLDLQRLDSDRMAAPDLFLRDFAEFIVRKLRLDVAEVEKFWRGSLGPQYKLTYLMEDYVLPETDSLIILALDEVDRLLNVPFHSDFFALLRSWHNSRALDEEWDKLNLVMVISTEPYQLISDINQSPFNVGLKIYLEDFDADQVQDLNQRHNAPVSEADFPKLVTLLGGHPYLTRKALYHLVTERMTWAELTQVAILDHGPFGDHLRRHHWLLRDKPRLQEALKQTIEHNHHPDEVAVFRLLQAGLVSGSGDSYACRCDLYRLYFKDKLP
jgi:serine/threonine protein kinase